MEPKPQEYLFGKTLEELKLIVGELGLPSYTATQIADWLYKKDILALDEMSNISKNARALLSQKYDLGLTPHSSVKVSIDGTKKYLFQVQGGHYIESAYIPEVKRNTLCISSQVGCMRRCAFCMTGKQGLQGNLSAGEILNQVHRLPEKEQLTNLVYMGMGEPFDNFVEVMKSLEILTAPWGYGWSPRRITVSTIGIATGIKTFLEQTACHLAISVHTPFEEERRQIMPVEKTHPIREIFEIIRQIKPGKQRKVSAEYIVFKDFNNTQRHVNEMARLLNGLRVRVNLIRFHEIPGTGLTGASDTEIKAFRDALGAKDITTTIRRSRGQDIEAACGLLSTKMQEEQAFEKP